MAQLKLIHGDCLDVMPKIPDKCIDMILCDLPYGVTARNKWDSIIPFKLLWLQYNRVIKDNAPIILTAIEPFASNLILSNPKYFRYDLIWQKPLATGFLNANRMPLRNHEQILVFYKKLPLYKPQKTDGKPYKLTRRSDTSNYGEVKNINQVTNNKDGKRFPVSVIKIPADKNKLHPTQKPVALFEYLIKTYTNEGALVLDNCMGSGTTGVACKRLNRHFIGIEKEATYFKIAQERINNAA